MKKRNSHSNRTFIVSKRSRWVSQPGAVEHYYVSGAQTKHKAIVTKSMIDMNPTQHDLTAAVTPVPELAQVLRAGFGGATRERSNV
jgi:hypothetical protein